MPLVVVLPRCEVLLIPRPRVFDCPLPLLGAGDVLPRPLPRKAVPRTDDMVVTVEGLSYRLHV